MSSNILKSILARRKRDVLDQLKIFSLQQAEKKALAVRRKDGVFLRAIARRNEVSVIAEMKRRSPSAGLLMRPYSPEKLARMYRRSGARALSVLTEPHYFGGKAQDLLCAKKAARLPVLRKDFIIHPFQIFESCWMGADCILLIVAALKKSELKEFYRLARSLKLDVLVEAHSASEIDRALEIDADIIGINNRNLKTLKTDLKTTFKLAGKISQSKILVSESGISDPETVQSLKRHSVSAILVGESILRSNPPTKKLEYLVQAGKK